ncbi:glycosyltransferase [Chryseobacterium formosus]|uniref:Glycosyltransferase n=1 Tax=Chryseobacterium formosus TaxID=1537363 RepID=A0ABT3XJJ4_9FLAO|nr:glycosyltransferase family 2 protein [Chryseobacterium formosus]MCX8522323.1 glycosyltransferase [Chryseobacterium formosus]
MKNAHIKMIYPKISIITPNFNGGDYLEETIKSIIDQDYPNLEYIIIDGGSTDNSIDIIKKYENHLAYWVSEPDNGLYHAIQKGLEKSSGEIMAWLNSDDIYHKKALFTVAEIFTNCKPVKWLQGLPTTIDEKGRTIATEKFKSWSKLDYYLGKFEWIQQESTFWHRDLWLQADSKINSNLKLAGDLDLWLRFFRYEKLYVTSALIGGFRQRSKNQLSLDHLDKYLIEARSQISLEIENNLTVTDKKALENIIRYSKKINSSNNRISFYINRKKYGSKINFLREKFFKAPPTIVFDRSTQSFILNKVSI